MRRFVDSSYIAASARMLRQASKNACMLIVEGDSDVRILSRFVDSHKCKVVNGFGKSNVVEAIYSLEEDGFRGVCGIVDSDFDLLIDRRYESDNIIVIQCHDLDSLIFSSQALELYLSQVADPIKLTKHFPGGAMDVRTLVFKSARTIGTTRLVSETNNLALRFKRLEYDALIDQTTLALVDTWFAHIVDRSNTACNSSRLKNLVETELQRGHEDLLVCQGHDLAALLGIALRGLIANCKYAQTYGSEVEIGLRLAFDGAVFQLTHLAADITAWEARNPGWVILRTLK